MTTGSTVQRSDLITSAILSWCLKRIERFLPADEYGEILQNVVELLANSASGSPLMRHVVESMGFATEKRDSMTYVTFKLRGIEELPPGDTCETRSNHHTPQSQDLAVNSRVDRRPHPLQWAHEDVARE